jgi:polar amino acid transport system substrate-binding protein
MKYLLCLILLYGILFGAGQAKAELKQIVIGTSTGYPPYYFQKDGKLVGLCIDIINYVAKEHGIKAIYQQYPWNRMLYNAKEGNVDAVMPLFKTKERGTYLYFPKQALAMEENRFFTWKQTKIQYSGDFHDLKPYKIGVVNNYSYGKIFDLVDYLLKEEALNDRSLLMKFKLKRFEVGIGNEYVVNFYARQLKLSNNIVFLKPSVTKDPLYIGFSKAKGHIDLIDKFSLTIAKLKQTERYQEILKYYDIQ